jgi:hypothetical protein
MKIYSICRSLMVDELEIVAQPHGQRSHWSTGDSGLSDGLMEPSHLDFMQKNRGPFIKPCNSSISSSMTWRDVVESFLSRFVESAMTLLPSPRTPKMASHTHTLAFVSVKSNPRACCRLRQRSQPPPRKILFSPTPHEDSAHIYEFTNFDISFHATS